MVKETREKKQGRRTVILAELYSKEREKGSPDVGSSDHRGTRYRKNGTPTSLRMRENCKKEAKGKKLGKTST